MDQAHQTPVEDERYIHELMPGIPAKARNDAHGEAGPDVSYDEAEDAHAGLQQQDQNHHFLVASTAWDGSPVGSDGRGSSIASNPPPRAVTVGETAWYGNGSSVRGRVRL
eukprot:CAMPEP_0168386778 /NCGR_PEP_ID=MMETSP0228-20121227/15603_1 /TAXON_ID=133427 /ORGANISM="Protoceratium reticulatum, Strain CCCM 535 (=CCMP 1889)" /LENGTH=109 /DNA_ID=CAMNT_0008399989 /DNA_START=340 /DNA_END=666 /DNA_ORIENTATION=-